MHACQALEIGRLYFAAGLAAAGDPLSGAHSVHDCLLQAQSEAQLHANRLTGAALLAVTGVQAPLAWPQLQPAAQRLVVTAAA